MTDPVAMPRPWPDPLVELVSHRLCVLGQPVRIRLIDQLELLGEMSVQTLADDLATTQQNVSRHLGLLLQADVVARCQRGRLVWYRLANPANYRLLEQVGANVLNELRR